MMMMMATMMTMKCFSLQAPNQPERCLQDRLSRMGSRSMLVSDQQTQTYFHVCRGSRPVVGEFLLICRRCHQNCILESTLFHPPRHSRKKAGSRDPGSRTFFGP